jgi:hypothetical protein
VTIQGCRRSGQIEGVTVIKSSEGLGFAPLHSVKKALPPLEVMPFCYSKRLLWLRLCLLSALSLLSAWVFLPLMSVSVLWGLPWVVGVVGVILAAKCYWCVRLNGYLAYRDESWWLQLNDQAWVPLTLKGDVLVLSWMVILHFNRALLEGEGKYGLFRRRRTSSSIAIIICRDSVSVRDFSRLKVWLRVCLRRSA